MNAFIAQKPESEGGEVLRVKVAKEAFSEETCPKGFLLEPKASQNLTHLRMLTMQHSTFPCTSVITVHNNLRDRILILSFF